MPGNNIVKTLVKLLSKAGTYVKLWYFFNFIKARATAMAFLKAKALALLKAKTSAPLLI